MFAVYNFTSMIFNLGFVIEYQNTYFNNHGTHKSQWSQIIGFQLVWNLITCLPFVLILLLFAGFELTLSESIVTILSLLLPYLILEPLKTMGSRHLQYNDRHRFLFIITSIATLLQYALVLIMIIHMRLGFISWFIGNLVNSLITALIYMIYLKKQGITIQLNFSVPKLIHRIKTQTSIILHNLSGFLLETSDRVILGLFKVPIEQIGAYNIAYNYTNYGQTVNNSLNTVFSPMYFKSIRKNEGSMNDTQVSRLFIFWINLVFFMAVNMIIWADYLFAFLYRNQHLNNTYIYAFPMIISLLYRPFYVMVVGNLIIQEKNRFIVFISLSGALLNVILNIIFIPFYGIWAAIYTTAFSYVFTGFAGLILPHIRKELTHVYFKQYWPVILLILAALVCINYIDFSALPVKISAFLTSVVFLLVMNRQQISDYLKRKPLADS